MQLPVPPQAAAAEAIAAPADIEEVKQEEDSAMASPRETPAVPEEQAT